MCEEPMQGACFIIQNIELCKDENEETENEPGPEEESKGDTFGPFAGQMIATVTTLIKKSFLNASPRIVEGMYLCSLQAPTPEIYGLIYNIMYQCRGKILEEEVEEGTNNFLLKIEVPLTTSFLFLEELR